jgi:hypothetical protein
MTCKSLTVPLLLSLLFVASSAGRTKQGRLYNLTTGAQTTLTYTDSGKGRGSITATLADEALKGEYTTVANGTVGWGAIYGSLGNAAASASTVSRKQEGTAILTGDKGIVIDCEYVTTPGGHGSGVCKDNHSVKYKLMF